jgi:hypothetical protein
MACETEQKKEEPKVLTISYKTHSSSIERSPSYPEEPDPYQPCGLGIPDECYEIKDAIGVLLSEFIGESEGYGWEKYVCSPKDRDWYTDIFVKAGKDDSGRGALVVELSTTKTSDEKRGIYEADVTRYFLYPNNLGTLKRVKREIREFKNEEGETVITQTETRVLGGLLPPSGFVDRLYLEPLFCAIDDLQKWAGPNIKNPIGEYTWIGSDEERIFWVNYKRLKALQLVAAGYSVGWDSEGANLIRISPGGRKEDVSFTADVKCFFIPKRWGRISRLEVIGPDNKVLSKEELANNPKAKKMVRTIRRILN